MTRIKREYLENGYAISRKLISGLVLDSVREEIQRLFEQQAKQCRIPADTSSGLDDFSRVAAGLFKADQTRYLAAAKLAQYTVSLHKLSLCDEILGVLHDLGLELPTVSTRQVLHIMADSLRVQGGYHKTPAHQDWRSVQGSLDGIVVWVPFSDVGRDNYPLEVLPGSHRLGLLPSTDDPFGHKVADGVVDDKQFVPLKVSKGDVVFLSTFTVHRTGAKGGQNIRMSGSFRFNNAAEPTYIERNYPNPYIYRPDMRLLTEGFPTDSDLRHIFPTKS